MRRKLWIALLVVTVPALWGPTCPDPNNKPQLEITSPVDGLFSNAANVTIEGSARARPGGGDIVDVTVNGVSVLPLTGSPENGTWSITLPLDSGAIFNRFLAVLELSGGKTIRKHVTVIAGNGTTTGFVNDGDFSPESVALRLNDSGLDDVEPVIESLVDFDINSLITPGTFLLNFCYIDSTFGCVASVDVFYNTGSVGGFTIDVDSQTNFVDGNINLQDLFIRADVVDGLAINCDIDINATSTDIFGDYTLEPGGPPFLGPDEIDVAQTGPPIDVTLGGFSESTSCGGLLGGLINLLIGLFIGDVQAILEPELENFLNTPDAMGNTPVAAAVEEALGVIEITGPIGDAIGVNLTTELFTVPEDVDGVTLGSDAKFESTPVVAGTCFDEFGMQIMPIDPCSVADPCPEPQVCLGNPGECVAHPASPDFPASYTVDESFPAFGPTTPTMALPYDLGICVSTSSFNQLLKAQLECGLLTQDVTEVPGVGPLNGAILSLLIAELAQFPLTTEYELRLRPTVSAVVDGTPGPGGELAVLRISSLNVTLRDVNEELPVLLHVTVDVDIPLDIDFVMGEVEFTLGAPTEDDIEIQFLINQIGADEVALGPLLEGLFVLAVPGLASALEGFPLPDFVGLSLIGVDVERNGEFMSLFLDLQ